MRRPLPHARSMPSIPRMTHYRFLAALVLLGCSSSGGDPATVTYPDTGGTTGSGGHTSAATGGSISTGGTTGVDSGQSAGGQDSGAADSGRVSTGGSTGWTCAAHASPYLGGVSGQCVCDTGFQECGGSNASHCVSTDPLVSGCDSTCTPCPLSATDPSGAVGCLSGQCAIVCAVGYHPTYCSGANPCCWNAFGKYVCGCSPN